MLLGGRWLLTVYMLHGYLRLSRLCMAGIGDVSPDYAWTESTRKNGHDLPEVFLEIFRQRLVCGSTEITVSLEFRQPATDEVLDTFI